MGDSDGEPDEAPTWSEDDERKERNEGLHPLFWENGYMPDDPNEPGRVALESFINEFTPLERAEAAKDAGNEYLKQGVQMKKKPLVREAISKYSEGLAFEFSDDKLRCQLCSNRAQAELHLGNWRNALQDCQRAVKYDSEHVKSYFRGARAALKLREWDQAQQLCAAGLQLEPSSSQFPAMRLEAADGRAAAAAAAVEVEAADSKRRAPLQKLAAALKLRGIQMTRPQLRVGGAQGMLPFLDAQDQLHLPLRILYPETQCQQSDSVEDTHELDTLDAHLDVMFGPEAPPLPWDERGEYTRDRIELYYLSNAGQPLTEDQIVDVLDGRPPEDLLADGPRRYGQHASGWVKVETSRTIQSLLRDEGHVIPGIPIFFAVAAGTEYRDRFLLEGH